MTSSNKMISRRQIIRGQQDPAQQQHGLQTLSSSSSSSTTQQSSASSSNKSSSGRPTSKQAQQARGQVQQQPLPMQQQQQMASSKSGRKLATQSSSRSASSKQQQQQMMISKEEHLHQQQQQQHHHHHHQADSSDGYIVNQYEDYADEQQQHHHHRHQVTTAANKDYWRHQDHHSNNHMEEPQEVVGREPSGAYRHFDPYSIYSEEDDVWYSEERLFEDHLEEIFNKWRLLDDDIWCKLIIMERNRRIGKAYARVPIVTIDGSHELSYDGYKLALNGFDNPDRDAKTEECRKRIGKGIRVKMDNFGNILIKRLSKSGVYIKEWVKESESASNSSKGGRLMPSRQQLIKNQNAMLAAMSNGGGGGKLGSQISSLTTSVTPSSSSGGSSMDPPNDSAICDEVISVGGRLDQDKIYVMFDMKKFQANITQELCRPYPDKRKLEQQCFSIVGLARDAEDILNLPCWVMVINIVAIEMLNERFPLMTNHHHHNNFPDTMLLADANNHRHRSNPMQPPNFVSIFEQNNNNNHERSSKDDTNKEEDPYSLPANASSSDVKSSINDYGTTSTKNMSALMNSNNGHHQAMPSRYYGASKRAEMYAHKKELRQSDNSILENSIKHHSRSKSNCNIYGPTSSKMMNAHGGRDRYNNSSSIYSPGHMLVPPSGDSVPPKLPPRDFVKKGKSKSSSNVSYDGSSSKQLNLDPNNESIYSTGVPPTTNGDQAPVVVDGKVRKTKRNRFLESLKAPLELAKSSNRSASVMGAPVQQSTSSELAVIDKKVANKSKGGFTKTGAKNLKSLLGVKGTKTKDTISDDSNFVHVDGDNNNTKAAKRAASTKDIANHDDGVEVDSVVDSNEGADDSQQAATNSSSSASYNDLDIPTPDYETDENIYALEDGNNYRGFSSSGQTKIRLSSGVNSKNMKSSKAHSNKEDLYYSGFRAHVPQNIGAISPRSAVNGKSILEDKISCIGSRENSRFLVHNSKMLISAASKMSGRDMIYGSTTGLPSMAGSRYRSASMQRYYPRTGQATAARSQTEMYDLESENPYAMSGSGAVDSVQSQYGVTGHRRRSGSKIANPYGINVGGGALHRVASGMANSNYDIGRSSSGIYGNNSSSSSSDYADWHPQMRKVNSSGYLNSIFKNHTNAGGLPLVDSFNTNPLNNNNNNNNNTSNSNSMAAHGYNNNSKQQQRSYTSRTLKSSRPASTLSKQHQHMQQHQQKQQAQIHQASSIVNGPTYRSYDSSNDSEPSYTNSSDGLDIYDHIGAHARLNHHHQFLDMPPAHNITPEVHVGEWENMYDR